MRGAAIGQVADVQHPQFARRLVRWGGRREVAHLGCDAGECAADDRISCAVAAFVGVERDAGHRLPGRTPELAALGIAQIDVAPRLVGGDRVVAVSRHSAIARVPVEGVASTRVRHDPAEASLPQVVQPGRRRVGPGDDVLARRGVVMAVRISHVCPVGFVAQGAGLRASQARFALLDRCVDADLCCVARRRHDTPVQWATIYGERHLVPHPLPLHGDPVRYAPEDPRVAVKPGQFCGITGAIRRPVCSGRMPRIHCVIAA